jgi:hypothetical protein
MENNRVQMPFSIFGTGLSAAVVGHILSPRTHLSLAHCFHMSTNPVAQRMAAMVNIHR